MCVKKFIFRKFGGLQAYSRQLYYQTPSQVFFDSLLSSPHAPPMCFDLRPPSNFEEHLWPLPFHKWGGGAQPLPMFTTPVHCGLWETLTQQCSSPQPATLSVGRYARSVCSAQIKFGDLGSLRTTAISN